MLGEWWVISLFQVQSASKYLPGIFLQASQSYFLPKKLHNFIIKYCLLQFVGKIFLQEKYKLRHNFKATIAYFLYFLTLVLTLAKCLGLSAYKV